jgi:protein-L-isoaspartate(D-aspartate) O-methyltransferase
MIFPLKDKYEEERQRMVETQLIPRGITDQAVLDAFRNVPREFFLPEDLEICAYEDCPLPIGYKQTISQPYMVALMTEQLELEKEEKLKILELGTGSGYQSAILSYLGHELISIERIPEVADFAKQNLEKTEYGSRVKVIVGDGCIGASEQAPFDRIIVTAASPCIPDALYEQLSIGGIIIIPCGNRYAQNLTRVKKLKEKKFLTEEGIGCRFVPLIGRDAFEEEEK